MKKILIAIQLLWPVQFLSAQTTGGLQVNWHKVLIISHAVPTLQVVNCPVLRRNSPVHDALFRDLSHLNAAYIRYIAWFIYPKLGVAELKPPGGDETSWDFSLLDPLFTDYMKATKGHASIINFSTVPSWMFKSKTPVPYPANPGEFDWGYGYGGKELRDTTMKELTDYFTRIVSWYTKGGFTDELGRYHYSGYHYTIPYWEVFNEPDAERSHSPESYTRQYDAIVTAIKKISPDTKFVGMALISYWNEKWFNYFLNPANHQPGIPLDMISYHFYAGPTDKKQKFEDGQSFYFRQADKFIGDVKIIDSIRKKLSPYTKTNLDELGAMLNDSGRAHPIPAEFWNLSGAVYAYLFTRLSRLNIDVMAESGLAGSANLFPDCSMTNPFNGRPNARYWVLKLLIDNFSGRKTLVETHTGADTSYLAQAFISAKGKKTIFINKINKIIDIKLPAEFKNAEVSVVDTSTGANPPKHYILNSRNLALPPFAVAIASIRQQ